MLADEVNDQLDPLRLANKRREVEAKRSLDQLRAVTHSDFLLREILIAQEEEEVTQKVREDSTQPSSSKRAKHGDSGLREHEMEIEEIKKLIGKKGGSKKK